MMPIQQCAISSPFESVWVKLHGLHWLLLENGILPAMQNLPAMQTNANNAAFSRAVVGPNIGHMHALGG
jgi:hypothetical protein